MTSILIVEDEIIIAEDLRITLNDLGYTVVDAVPSGEEAIERAKSLKPDLIFMDIKLRGEMDGVEAAKKISEKYDIPIIFLTAFTIGGIKENINVMKDFNYIEKPFERKKLVETIRKTLGHSKE